MPKKVVAIKNFDEELYRLIKTYASLENKTVASIIEEAVRSWLTSRRDYEEALAWVRLEREYRKNIEALRKNLDRLEEGYALVCDGRVVGVFDSYLDAAKKSAEIRAPQALIVKLPVEAEAKKLELGLPC